MLFRSSRLVCLIFFEILAAHGGLQATTPQAVEPTLKAAARLVVVDVIVTDASGKPIRGLHKEDFEVRESGKKQTVVVFEEHTGKPPTEIKLPSLPPNTFNNFPRADGPDALNVILLDSLNTSLTDQSYVHQQVLKYLHGMNPGEPIAIFILSERLRMVHGFTSNLPALLGALNDKSSHSSPNPSPLLRSGGEVHAEGQAVSQMQDLSNKDPDIQAAMDALRQFQAEEAAGKTDVRVRSTLTELQQLAGYLSGFPVRKNLVWFSGAFPLMTFQEQSSMGAMNPSRQYAELVSKTADALARARVAIYPVAAEGLAADSLYDASVSPTTITNARGATREEVHQLRADSIQRNANHATMDELARDTGGKAFYNTNGLDEALAQAIHDGAGYYTLDYVPTNQNMDGSYRQIGVKLNQGHYQLAYRRGYNADDEQTSTNSKTLSSGDPLQPFMESGLPDFSQIPYLMSVKPASPQPKPIAGRAGDNAKVEGPFTRMDVDLAISEESLQWEMEAQGVRHGTLEVSVIAYDRYGTPMNWLMRNIDLSLDPKQYETYRQVGLQFHFDVDAPRGADSLRSGVCDLASRKAGTIEVLLNALPATVPQESKSN